LKQKRAALLFIVVTFFSVPAFSFSAESGPLESLLEEGERYLEAWNVPQAEEIASRIRQDDGKSVRVLDFEAQLAFYEGRYADALRSVEDALAMESTDERRHALRLLAQLTNDTVKKLKRHESEHFVLHLDDARDGILAPFILDTMEKSYEAIGAELGYFPPAKVRVEIAPDVSSFNAISTLSLRDIEQTGAVGICKFNKIMTISPRNLVHGYRWLDSLSHEYLHYAIVALTSNKAPIWLHEGIARYYETFWQRTDGSTNNADYLTPSSQTLLARALSEQRFVGFKNMAPSLIHLETPKEVELAYAEAASAIDFIIHSKGQTGMRALLSEVGERPTPEAIEKVMGISFELFETQWQEFLKSKGLKEIEGSRVRRFKVKGKENPDEETVDLKEIQSVVARKRTGLADRLLARGRMVASAAEYRRALQASPHSTIILNRLGRVLVGMEKYEDALPHLKKAVALDPDYVGTHVKLGRLYLGKKNYLSARNALEEAIRINPFDPTIHHLLSQVYTALGDLHRAKDSKATLEKLIRRK
jgi:tetratricopeptide (TPR) repeat protein